MRFVEEVVVDEFLPTFRSLLAEALRERGLTQSEVADLLGISQSAVSKYVHGEVERNERLLETEALVEHVEYVADGLDEETISPVQALVETEVLIRELERGGVLASLHETVEPSLAEYDGEFAVHDPDSRLREAERILSSVRQGIHMLENESGFTELIPAVGSNLVETLADPEGIEDVAGVPGRILDVKGRATIPGDPEFGMSEHAATVLLAARSGGSEARAAINVAYDEATLARFEDAGLTAVEFDAEADPAESVEAALTERPDADVLYQVGGFGIEPILYVLGSDAVTVARTVRDVL